MRGVVGLQQMQPHPVVSGSWVGHGEEVGWHLQWDLHAQVAPSWPARHVCAPGKLVSLTYGMHVLKHA